MNDEFDGWIERELHAAFAGLGDSIPEPAYRKAPRRGLRLRNLVPAVIGGKLAAGIAITCMAAASSVAASAVVTGSPDPFTLIHRSPAPAAAPDSSAHPTAPGEGNEASGGGAASNAASNGVQHGDSGGPDTGTAQSGGGRSSGGSAAGGNAGITAPGQSDASHGAGTGNGVATGDGHDHSADASSRPDRHREP